MLARIAPVALALSLVVGCAFNDANDPATGADESGLQVHFDADKAKGSYDFEGRTFVFASERVRDHLWDVNATFDGLSMTFYFDQDTGVIEMDGWANANGGDSQMTRPDRELVIKLRDRLDKFGTEVPEGLKMIRRVLDHWSDWPETVSLQRVKLFDEARTITSICGSCRSYRSFTHDCSTCGSGTDSCTAYGYVGQIGSYSCGGGTKWGTSSGTLTCLTNDPSHTASYEYGYGNCFGRCGAGCASEKDYTADCGNHDLCVRSGHATASLYCDDEFTSCSDDEVSAPGCSTC